MVKSKSERLGLLMIASSLIVIVVILALLFRYQKQSRLTQIRSQGVSLARLISEMPYEHLMDPVNQHGLFQVLKQSQSSSSFAYVAIVDPKGDPVAQVAAPGTIVPPRPFGEVPPSWLGEQLLTTPGGARPVRDFHAPLRSKAGPAGYVRVGYFEPGHAVGREQVPFFATLALPIFLLTPLFYLLVKREIRPLTEASFQIQDAIEAGELHRIEVTASGELQQFIQGFNRFIQMAEDRMEEMQLQKTRMLTSKKVLTYQKNRMETVLEALPEAVTVLDESGAVAFANAKLEPLVGVDVREIGGKKPHEWCQDPNLLAFLARYNGSSTGPLRAASMEFTPSGSPGRKIRVSGHPLLAPTGTGESAGTLIVYRDVTSEALAKLARSEFVAHVAHELKSPLNVLTMYGEMLAGEDGKREDVRVEAVNVIQDEVDRLSTLIKNLLNITNIEMGSISLDRRRVKLGELLKDVFDTVSRSARAANLDLKLDLPQDLSPVSIDKELFRVALNNLLTNAIKYNRPGGTVWLAAEENAEEIRIQVRDTGIGVAEEDQKKIFEKFFRSETEEVRERTGHGLGLPLAREVVELHHGRIEVDSTPGEGSEFSIVFKKNAGLVQEAI